MICESGADRIKAVAQRTGAAADQHQLQQIQRGITAL